MTLTKFKREKRKCLLCLIFSVILIISSFILTIYTYNHNNKVKADTMENNVLYDNIYVLKGSIMCVNDSTNKVLSEHKNQTIRTNSVEKNKEE